MPQKKRMDPEALEALINFAYTVHPTNRFAEMGQMEIETRRLNQARDSLTQGNLTHAEERLRTHIIYLQGPDPSTYEILVTHCRRRGYHFAAQEQELLDY